MRTHVPITGQDAFEAPPLRGAVVVVGVIVVDVRVDVLQRR